MPPAGPGYPGLPVPDPAYSYPGAMPPGPGHGGMPQPRRGGGGSGCGQPMGGGGMDGRGRFQGRIKSFNSKQGFGFIECADAHAQFGRDVFLHKAQIGDLKVGTEVIFSVEANKQGMPQARDLQTLDGHVPGPAPASVAKGGAGGADGGGKGGGSGGGGGKGGG